MSVPATIMLVCVALLLLLPSPCRSEFTVVMSDSSPLLDAPQTSFSSNARTDPSEQRAVYEIMSATGNDWASSIPDVCRGRWHGIECLQDRDEVYHVTSLSFGALSDDTAFPVCDSAKATLSPAVTNLPHIRSLFFYRCFSGNPQPVPTFLGRLGTALRTLVLRENGHVGGIPMELGNLTALRVLDLHGNQLVGAVPPSLAGLRKVRMLDLSANRLTGSVGHIIPAGGGFQELVVLDLSGNGFSGRIPDALARSPRLAKLDLSRNRFSGPITDSIASLTNLILLDLSDNNLFGLIPAALTTGLISLRALILARNPLGPSESLPADGFAALEKLETLVLSNTGLAGSIPVALGRHPAVRVLHLDGNNLSGPIPSSFRQLERLSELRLDGNKLTGPVPFDRKAMWRMGRRLKVEGNPGLCFHAGAKPVSDRGAAAAGVPLALHGVASCQDAREVVASAAPHGAVDSTAPPGARG